MAKHDPAEDKRKAQRRGDDRRKGKRRSKRGRRDGDKLQAFRNANPGENFPR